MSIADVGVTAGALRRRIAQRLGEAGIDTATLDARLLLAHVLGLDAAQIVLADDRPVSGEEERRVLALAGRRVAGEPVARLTGKKEFWSLVFSLSPETLVPRPDTETVVEAALRAIERDGRRDDPLAILDLGTGSGAILLALLSELPLSTGLGIDRAAGAVETARANAERFGLTDRAAFAVGDWAGPVGGRFDVVVANPPYIPTRDIAALPVAVSRHDPHLALDGGEDGFASHRAILVSLEGLLAQNCAAFIEVGSGQAAELIEIAARHALEGTVHTDLAGVDRVVELRRGRR